MGHPKCPHMSFYYNLLLAHIPFRDEQTVLRPDGDYFVECVRQRIFTTIAELDKHIKAYAKYHLWTNAVLDQVRGDIDSFVSQATAAALQLPHPGTHDGPDNEAADPDSAEVYAAGAAAFQTMQLEVGREQDSEPEQGAPAPKTGGSNGIHTLRYVTLHCGPKGHPRTSQRAEAHGDRTTS